MDVLLYLTSLIICGMNVLQNKGVAKLAHLLALDVVVLWTIDHSRNLSLVTMMVVNSEECGFGGGRAHCHPG